jgi:hypothetical protein
MAEITIIEHSPGTYRVEVAGKSSTSHEVKVPSGLAQDIGGAGVDDADFVLASFKFLLEREPNTSILRTFSIEVIGSYFPEWRDEMKRRLAP